MNAGGRNGETGTIRGSCPARTEKTVYRRNGKESRNVKCPVCGIEMKKKSATEWVCRNPRCVCCKGGKEK